MSSEPRQWTYALVPGAGGESWYWHLVAPRLRALGHAVVAPDLPYSDPAAGLPEFADVVVDAVDGASPLVVVGQSMGAFTATTVCERSPVDLLILVAPMIPAPGESPGEWWANTGQPAASRAFAVSEGRDPDAPFDVMTGFFHDVPDDVVEEAMARGEPPQSDTPFGQRWPNAAWPEVPTRVLAGGRDRLFPPRFVRRLARERLGLDVDLIDAGHLPALARPAEVAERLEGYRVDHVLSARQPARDPT